MKKFIKTTGVIGATGLVLSVIFKFFHLMGAPTLLLIGTVSTGLFIVSWTINKLRGK